MWDWIDKAAGTIFGDEDEAGLGGGQQRFEKHDINKGSYENPNTAATQAELARRLGTTDARQAPAMQAAQQNGIREYAGANVAPTERTSRVALGPAAMAGSATVARDDTQFRNGQLGLVNALQAQAAGAGPSLAENTLRQAQEANVARQMGVTAAGGGNPAVAQRAAMNYAATAQRQAGSDAANIRTQEQLNAQAQLANALAGGRAQDIGVASTQAGFDQQSILANQGARNTFGLEQGRMDLQNAQFNAGNANTRAALQAQLAQQAGLASQGQYNAMLAQNTAYQQAANQQNLGSQLQTMGMNDAQARYLLDAQVGIDERNRQAMIAYEKDMAQNAQGYMNADLQAYEAAAQRRKEMLSSGGEISPTDYSGGGG